MSVSEERCSHYTYLHLVHSFLSVPMQEGFTFEHGRELITDTLEEFLDGSRVTEEGNSHLETPWCNLTLSAEDIVGDPLDEVGRVFVLDVLHLLLDFLHRHLATEDSGNLRMRLRRLQHPNDKERGIQ